MFKKVILAQPHRDRSNTIDSSASFAESRFGQFDVHDEHDRYHGEEINLHHDEVAYERPRSELSVRKLSKKSSLSLIKSFYSHQEVCTLPIPKLRSTLVEPRS